MNWNFKLLTILGLATVLTLGACSKKAASVSEINFVSVNNLEPQAPLIPADTNEIAGGRVLTAIFSGLIYYDEKGKIHNDLAQSIKSADKQHYLVTLKEGIKFSDGTPIKAENFVKAWNYAVANKLKLMTFYEFITGYNELKKNSKLTGMTGLKVIDEKSFTIDLIAPVADFENMLGYYAFFPLPDVAFDDLAAYGQAPISSGPYKLANADAWQHNQSITAEVNEFYQGPRKAENAGIKFVLYAKYSAAYSDVLSGQLDVLDKMPEEQYASYQSDFGARAVAQPSAKFQSLAINVNLPHFKLDAEGLLRRQALSMAINRQQITDVIFKNTRSPTKDFTAPVVAGYNANIAGNEVLNYNPELAKKLWQQAEELSPFDGNLTIAYNADADHKGWVDAVTNQWKNVLGVKAGGDPYPDFKSLRDEIKNRQIKFASRSGWQADYPSAYNFLQPLYHSDAVVGSNDSDYRKSQVDALLKQASLADNRAEWQSDLDRVQEILLRDLPVIPLWNENSIGAYSEKVSNVIFSWNDIPLYHKIHKEK